MRRAKPHLSLEKISFKRKVFQAFICEHFFALRTGAKNSYPRRKLRKFILLKGTSRRKMLRLINLSPKCTCLGKKHILELRGIQKVLRNKLKTFFMGRTQKTPSPFFPKRRRNVRWRTLNKGEFAGFDPLGKRLPLMAAFHRKGQKHSKINKKKVEGL